ncbi:MAG: ADP-ribosylglycohydrolase [marine bacterium B5-7]|nr:MAG: ADP-ribosylglycohydrolase [marine bacterium B5-7]
MDLVSRYQGALLGLAVGDALGTTLEFKQPGSFVPIDNMIGGGPFGLRPGEWTDDTSMALCLVESLLEKENFDAKDQMDRYVRWYKQGYLSSTGRCFDIGTTVRNALDKYLQNNNPFAGSSDPHTGGNGSLMRLAPIPLAFATVPEQAIEYAGSMSCTTHAAAEAIDACRYYSGLILGALAGVEKQDLLSTLFHPVKGRWMKNSLSPAIESIANGSFHDKQPPDIRGSGYVVDALEASLWAFASTDDFKSGALAAVNLGDDADTTGAIFGQLAGAYYGKEAIPNEWLSTLHMTEEIQLMAENLHQFSISVSYSK